MTTKYWIGVACAIHVNTGRKHQICAFGHGKHSAVKRLKAGDRFIYYATKEDFADGKPAGQPVQAFIASGTVISHEPREGDFEGQGPAWLKDAKYDAPFHVPVKPLLNELTFITNPQYWGMAFRRSLFEISEPDFERILAG